MSCLSILDFWSSRNVIKKNYCLVLIFSLRNVVRKLLFIAVKWSQNVVKTDVFFIILRIKGTAQTRNIGYPKNRVMLFWDKHRVALLKTRISKNLNYPTRIFRVTRMPRLRFTWGLLDLGSRLDIIPFLCTFSPSTYNEQLRLVWGT
jgi:hypothetical protein